MTLLLHVIFALASVGSAFLTIISPSISKFRTTHFLTAATLLSGLTMLFTYPINLVKMCLSGILYLGLIIPVLIIAKKRLEKFKMNIIYK